MSLKQLSIETKESPQTCSYYVNKLIDKNLIFKEKRGIYVLKSLMGYEKPILSMKPMSKKRLDNLKFKIPLYRFDADHLINQEWDIFNSKVKNNFHLYKHVKHKGRFVTLKFILSKSHNKCSLLIIIPKIKQRAYDFTSIIEEWDYQTNIILKDISQEYKFNYAITDKQLCSGTDYRISDGIKELGVFDHSNIKQDDSEKTGHFEIEGKNLEKSEYLNSIKDIIEDDIKPKINSMDDVIDKVADQDEKFKVFANMITNQMDKVISSLNILAKNDNVLHKRVDKNENMFG